ncbi:helix-hairpin-helix domain-containing protein [Niabella sp.]|uniref:ComEA family DNA-binding protein n=1 Tax=Niabella sp. TaxID=1962976 RepID=UPI002615145F|nr:helix-hairpin-helix domain-containing protein [Niabella sp.]
MKAYLRFSKKELTGLLLLIIIMLFFAIQPFIQINADKKPLDAATGAAFSKIVTTSEVTENNDKSATDLLPAAARTYRKSAYTSLTKGTLFNFDPNTLDAAGWLQLGLRERTVQTILRYRNKGGRFRKPEDLQKIYGLHKDAFERLHPYITIASPSYQTAYPPPPAAAAGKTVPRSTLQPVNINTADTTAFKAFYGIGSRLAARIVNYREKLGGFYSIRQVGETYGVPDSVFEHIKPFLLLGNPDLRQLNINTASYEALNAHPYISSKLAYLIVKQRKSAPFASIDDLQALVIQTNDVFEKLKPYILIEVTETQRR